MPIYTNQPQVTMGSLILYVPVLSRVEPLHSLHFRGCVGSLSVSSWRTKIEWNWIYISCEIHLTEKRSNGRSCISGIWKNHWTIVVGIYMWSWPWGYFFHTRTWIHGWRVKRSKTDSQSVENTISIRSRHKNDPAITWAYYHPRSIRSCTE